jgi:WD40 repeat protein
MGHYGAVLSVAFSRDGTWIVSGGDDEVVRLWALDGAPVVEPFRGNSPKVSSVAVSGDGTRIVSFGEDGTVRLSTFDGKHAAGPFTDTMVPVQLAERSKLLGSDPSQPHQRSRRRDIGRIALARPPQFVGCAAHGFRSLLGRPRDFECRRAGVNQL